jgi:hypothetical protein
MKHTMTATDSVDGHVPENGDARAIHIFCNDSSKEPVVSDIESIKNVCVASW